MARTDSAPWLRQALLTLLLAIDEGVHIVDDTGVTVYYNAQAGELDGLEPETVIGKHLLDVYPSLTRETSTLLQVCRTKRPLLSEQQTFTNYKGQRITTINMTLPILVDHRLVGAVEVSKNITAVRELSERLIDLQTPNNGLTAAQAAPILATARHTLADIYGQNPAMVELKALAQRAAATNTAMLIVGEAGTGKRMLAQAVHNASRRRRRPFLAQNCASVPEFLLEAMLYGTTHASFPSAENRPGLLEAAHGGTLCLLAIDAMSVSLQGKLLGTLQDGHVSRLGDTRRRPIDVRVIATITSDPLQAVRRGSLRADLYTNLKGVTLRLPPLRERRDDCLLLANHFLHHYNQLYGRQVVGFAENVKQLFAAYSWPGNVSELRYAVEGAVSGIDGDVIEPMHLPADLRSGRALAVVSGDIAAYDPFPMGRSLHENLAELEARLIDQAMRQARGNVTLAGEILGVPRQTLQYKLRQRAKQ